MDCETTEVRSWNCSPAGVRMDGMYLKLKSPRKRDEADVVELLRINDPKPVRLYLKKNAPEMLPKFDAAASEAES